MAEPGSGVLTAPNIVEYPFHRTTGPVVGAFFTALREGFVVGIKGSDGRVIVPPVEYDPVTAETLTEVVEVGNAGEVLSWAWASEPQADQPLDGPFAWALVKLDGADTGLLHAVDTGGDESKMATGMRVEIRWRDPAPKGAEPAAPGDAPSYREGAITDILCFVPEGEG